MVEAKFKQTGFSLIEIAMSLIIIGVLLGGIAIPVAESFKNNKIKNNTERIIEAREAIIGFVIRNQRLPCPAKVWVDSTNPDYAGVEACDSDILGTDVESCTGNTCSGYLPWKTLSIKQFDAWGNPFFYSVNGHLTTESSFRSMASNTSTPSSASFDLKVMGRAPEHNYKAYTIANNIAAVLGSLGRYNIIFDPSTGATTLPTSVSSTTDEANNFKSCCTTLPLNLDNAESTFYQRPESPEDSTVDDTGNRIGSFDDQILWIPFYQLLGIMAKTDRLYID